jgi:hypothetical protein
MGLCVASASIIDEFGPRMFQRQQRAQSGWLNGGDGNDSSTVELMYCDNACPALVVAESSCVASI